MRDASDYASAAMPLPVILAVGGALLLASTAVYVARRALGLLVPDEPDAERPPFVCPGCFAFNGRPCSSDCPDLAIEMAREDDRDRDEWPYDDGDFPW